MSYYNRTMTTAFDDTAVLENSTGNRAMSGLKLVLRSNSWAPEVVQRVVTLVILIVATLCGNVVIIVILTCSKYRKLNSRVNIFIINLAIGDLTVCCVTMTTEILFVSFDNAWVLGYAGCKILLYAQIITLASTTFILTAMSFDRYLAICRPLSLGGASSASRAKTMIIVSWILAFVFASPQIFIFTQVPDGVYPDGEIRYKCKSQEYTAWWQRKTYFTFMTSYILVIPAFVISFCYINVVSVVWHQGKEFSQRGGVALRKTIKDARFLNRAKIKTIKMTFSIISSFIVCWTPYFVVHLIHIWTEYKYEIPESIYAIVETLALFNSALNPLLYGFFNIELKRGMIEVCCPLRANQMHRQSYGQPLQWSESGMATVVASDKVRLCPAAKRQSTSAGEPRRMTIIFDQSSSGSNGRKSRDEPEVESNSTSGLYGYRGKNIVKEENQRGFKLRVRFLSCNDVYSNQALLPSNGCAPSNGTSGSNKITSGSGNLISSSVELETIDKISRDDRSRRDFIKFETVM